MRVVFLSLAIVLSACNGRQKIVNKIFDNRTVIEKAFASKTLIHGRVLTNAIFKTYSGNLKNEYFIEMRNGNWKLEGDSIEYRPGYMEVRPGQDSMKYMELVFKDINELQAKMDEFKIRDFSSDFRTTGIALKIYLVDAKGVMLFLSDPSLSRWPDTKNYVYSMSKLDSHWYYTFDE